MISDFRPYPATTIDRKDQTYLLNIPVFFHHLIPTFTNPLYTRLDNFINFNTDALGFTLIRVIYTQSRKHCPLITWQINGTDIAICSGCL